MRETAVRRSPLERVAQQLAAGSSGERGARLAEIRLSSLVNLRLEADGPGLGEAVRLLGVELPLAANTFTRGDALRCLWLGPDEWLVVCEPGGPQEVAERLRECLAGEHASVIEVSAAYAALELAGAKAREVLAKACSLDLHPRAFLPGQCAQSNFARTQAILMLEDDSPVFRLFVRRSFATYLADWLLDAMSEYRRRD
jgi:sarcosine oxidase subunit gamma